MERRRVQGRTHLTNNGEDSAVQIRMQALKDRSKNAFRNRSPTISTEEDGHMIITCSHQHMASTP